MRHFPCAASTNNKKQAASLEHPKIWILRSCYEHGSGTAHRDHMFLVPSIRDYRSPFLRRHFQRTAWPNWTHSPLTASKLPRVSNVLVLPLCPMSSLSDIMLASAGRESPTCVYDFAKGVATNYLLLAPLLTEPLVPSPWLVDNYPWHATILAAGGQSRCRKLP